MKMPKLVQLLKSVGKQIALRNVKPDKPPHESRRRRHRRLLLLLNLILAVPSLYLYQIQKSLHLLTYHDLNSQGSRSKPIHFNLNISIFVFTASMKL